MKKIIFLSAILALGALVGSEKTSAYGGGGGFPPGYFDNPNARPGLVCEWRTMDLPSGHQVTVPACRVVRTEKQVANISERLSDFLTRVKNGNR